MNGCRKLILLLAEETSFPLVGKESPYLHGAMIPVDGGVLAALRPDPFEG